MPLLDHFRLTRLAKAVPPPLVSEESEPRTRLGRMLARQKPVRLRTELEKRIQALEEEYPEPLYGASAYSSPPTDRRED